MIKHVDVPLHGSSSFMFILIPVGSRQAINLLFDIMIFIVFVEYRLSWTITQTFLNLFGFII